MSGKNSTGVDLDAMTVQELVTLRDAAEAKRMQKLDGERNAILQEARARLEAIGLSSNDFLKSSSPVSTRKAKREPGVRGNVAVKYRGPNGEPWSGRGRSPKWVQVAEAEGKSREDFKV